MEIYVGNDASKIKKLLSRIATRCIIAVKSNQEFGFAVTKDRNIRYNQLVRELKKIYSPTVYKYIRGSMIVTCTKDDKETGEVTGGIISLNIFKGEEEERLPEESRLKRIIQVSNINVNDNVDIPLGYQREFQKSVYDDSDDT